jgi:pimeloyl-ACP methyl ester carboxylesterase
MHVLANGVRVSYSDQGEGRPVVLLHGGMVTGDLMWSGHVRALAERHRVLVPDTRGHGGSDNPDGVFGYDLFADDVAAFIDALGLERPVVVGYSDGAQTGIELGLRHPDRIGGLVLGGVVVDPAGQYLEALAAMGFTVPGEFDADAFEGLHPGFTDFVKSLHSEVHGPHYWRTFVELTSRLWLTLPDYSAEVLAKIPVPTLVISGDADEAPLAQAPGIVRAVPNAELAVIPGADHAAVERTLFRDVVLDFLARRG